jgi:hypothetical protein
MSSAVKSTKFYSGFTPLSIPSCYLWLDAADANTLTLSGSSVSQWNDKSGNGYHASQATPTRRPTLQTNQINGLPAIKWDGVDDNLTGTMTYPTTGQTTLLVLFRIVALGDGSPVDQRIFDIGGNGYGNFASPSGSLSSEAILWLAGATYPGSALYTQVAPTTGVKLYSVLANGTSSLMWRYGNAMATFGTGATITPTGTTYTLGNIASGANSSMFSGQIAEIVFYSRNLTTSERQQVEGYLSYKWGTTTSMPSVHPYKAIKPATRAFQPVDISSCAFWLDAADATTVTLSGTKVTQWSDKISNYAFTQSTDGNRPSYAYNSTAKNNVLSFARASSQYLVGPSNLPLGTNSISMFCAFSCTDNTTGSIFNKGGAGGTGIQFWRASGLNSILLGPASPSVDRIDFVDSTTLGTFQVTGFVNDRSIPLTSAYQNGTFKKSITADNTTNFTNSTLMGIGAYGNSSGNFSPPFPDIYFNGNICEILIFLSALSTSERQQVEGYLANKWKTKPALISTQPFKLYNPLTVSFNPNQISNCSLWLDAADATTVTLSESNVTAWNDKSGNGYNLSTVNNPVYTLSSVNRLNAITTNGTNNYLQNTTLSIAQPFTFFSVAKLRTASTATYQLVLQGTNASGSTAVVLFTPATSSVLTMWAGTANVTTSPTIAITSNVTHLYEAVFNNSSSVLGRNGTITTGLSPGTLALNGFRVGAEWNLGIFQPGEHCENIIYNRVLSTSERQQVEGYLAKKWGLQTNLPSAHPYKKITP